MARCAPPLKASTYTGFNPLIHASPLPAIIPAIHPHSRADGRSQRVNRPQITAGKICRIQMPPSSCRSIANCVGSHSTQASAPTFTSSDTILAMRDSVASLKFGLMYARQMLRVTRLAAPIDMIAAGTSAPSAIAAKQKPANHGGKLALISAGTAIEPLLTLMCAASAMYPSRAISPSRKLYAGSHTALRRIALEPEADKVAVIECGYRNNANAEPSASVANDQY